MKLLKILFVSIAVLLFGITISAAQTVTNFYGESHGCGLRTAPHSFTTPKGTVAYYDFVSDLGKYFRNGSLNFNYYDATANEYHKAPTVAFILESFYSVEFGSTHRGLNGAVLFLIRAYECNDLLVDKGNGEKQFIAQLTTHLRYLDYAEAKPENAVNYLGEFGRPFLEALARHDGKILVIARPVALYTFSARDRMQRLNLEFVIENFIVLK